MKRKGKLLLSIVIPFILILASLFFLYDYVHYSHSKDNIFEIPQTYDLWESGNSIRYEKFYFIQYVPKSRQELESLIKDYVNDNKILEDAKNNDANYVALNFMIPDHKLPIFFEENKSYFNMDDYIKNYIKSNRIALYTYDFKNNAENLTISYK